MHSIHRIIDHNFHGLVVGAFAHPPGWEADSQVGWRFEDTANPCQVYAKTWNPAGSEGWEVFSAQPFYWIEWGAQEGSWARGTMALRPRPVVEVLQQVVIPRFRPQFQIVRVGKETRLPPPAPGIFHESVRVLVTYGDFEEEFLAVQVVLPPPPGGGQTNWGLDQLYAFRARRGELEGRMPELWKIHESLKWNPRWQQLRHDRIQQINADVQRFHQMVGDYHRGVAMAAQQQLEYIQHSSQVSQRIYDFNWYADEHIQQGRGEVLGGYETYRDPYYGTSQHGYHKFVFTDGQGNYRYSDDPLYNPNLNSSRTWNPLDKLS